MKKTKKVRKPKQKTPEVTQEELKKLCEDLGFEFVLDKKPTVFGKPAKDLHQGDTVIIPEGSNKGFKV